MAHRPHSYARVNPSSPSCWGQCDRCGFIYNLNDLVWQFDWRGDKLVNTKFRVCKRTCLDKPYEGRRPLKLPPDPLPATNPRPISYASDEANGPSVSESSLLYGQGAFE